MKGRKEAVLVTLIATGTVLFAWLGAVVIALVTLRKGPSQGGYVLLWGLFPAVVVAAFGDTGPLTTLLGVMLAAVVLRATAAWSWALLAAVVSGLLTATIMLTVGSGYIELIMQMFGDLFAEMAKQAATAGQESAAVIEMPGALQVAGLLGVSNAFIIIICLIFGRWWQSLLYNPGGFRQEFHLLRLPPLLVIVLLLSGFLLTVMGSDYRFWAVICALPFLFAGVALVHGVFAQKNLGRAWLVAFYCAWLLLAPIKIALLILVVADSWLDIRKRIATV
jgi:hypothetical protein